MILTNSPVARTIALRGDGPLLAGKAYARFSPTKWAAAGLNKTGEMNREVPKNFCILPFVSVQVRANGSLSACCQNSDSARDANHDELLLYKDSFRDGLQSEYFQELRRDFLAGRRPASCQRCFDEDDMGVRSRRKNENENHQHWIQPVLRGEGPSQPVVFDLNLGTLCNLKCRTCGPASSSKWVQESIDLFGEDHLPRDNQELRRMPPEESRKIVLGWQDKSPDFYSTLTEWLPKAERMEFFGGEPMISKHHINLVRQAVESGSSKHQILRYATNGTVVSKELQERIWPSFKEVHLNVSVDGLDRQFEYIRFGANWNKLLETLEDYRRIDNITAVGINITVSVFNIYYLPEMFLFWQQRGLVSSRGPDLRKFGIWKAKELFTFLRLSARRIRRGGEIRDIQINENNYVHIPERFDIRILPPALKEKVKEKFETFYPKLHPDLQRELRSALTKMYSKDLSNLWPRFIESVWFHDQYRNQSFAEVFPEFHRHAVDAGVWWHYKDQPEYFFTPEELIKLGHPPRAGQETSGLNT